MGGPDTLLIGMKWLHASIDRVCNVPRRIERERVAEERSREVGNERRFAPHVHRDGSRQQEAEDDDEWEIVPA